MSNNQQWQENIDKKMELNGYARVSGMAIIDDMAVTQTSTQVIYVKLTTQQAVDCFNNECCDDWTLYRAK